MEEKGSEWICPICGAEVWQVNNTATGKQSFRCLKCGLRTEEYGSISEAWYAWLERKYANFDDVKNLYEKG